MPLIIGKFWGRGQPTTTTAASKPDEPPIGDGNSVHFGFDCVRILLFLECEWQGRKLLFDSIALQRNKQPKDDNDNIPLFCRNAMKKKQVKCQRDNAFIESTNGYITEYGKLLSEDISLLSEMIFGTVAMTYRGPSFKIHAMQSPGYIMCTKVFPYSQPSECKQREGDSQQTYSVLTNIDSTSNNSKQRSQYFRSSTGNLLGNNLGATLDKSSTCFNSGNGWDINVTQFGSSQSLDDNGGSSVSSGGSLSSLRRRWLRVMSTSLNQFNSDDAFGHNNNSPMTEAKDMQARKHKTRLGLAMILQLPNGNEQKVSSRLLEHAAFLEGMLDRLRHSCIEGKSLEIRNLVIRLCRISNCCTLRLLRLLTSLETATTSLVWHDLLLNSTMPSCVKVNSVHRSLQQMFSLLEELDTKSTNFFISTIVTAVLTHHLGWVHTAPPRRNRQLLDNVNVDKQFACNPLWAQLNDLYGALGTPARIAHTVIAGEPGKTSLIDSILGFLSYFLRSGLVDRHHESRCPDQEDVREAIDILERAGRKKPNLEQPSSSARSSTEANYHKSFEEPWKCPEPKLIEESLEKNLEKPTRSAILQKVDVGNGTEELTEEAKIINESKTFKDGILTKKKTFGNEDADETLADLKLQQKLMAFDNFHPSSKTSEDRTLAYLSSLGEDATHEITTQVYFTLGNEEKPSLSIRDRLRSTCKCQCSYTFTRVPSTSAELPEGVLRKIIQRNFPESSKNIQPTSDCEGDFGVCLKCRRGYASSSQGFENNKLLLETPTNATEMLRGCRGSTTSRALSSNSLEALIEASCVIELPMPRSKKVPPLLRKKSSERVGFSKSLLSTKVTQTEETLKDSTSGYTWGMVVQGFTKRKRRGGRRRSGDKSREEWWWPIREGLGVEAKFPLVDQPISEALCILGDLDSWQVGLLSNSAGGSSPIPVGMSRLVSNMLEAFACMWKEFRSPVQCIKLLESRLREMWMRSETLAEFLLAADLADANMNNLTSFLDLDAADLPLLLAVATTHTPQIAQRLGLTLA